MLEIVLMELDPTHNLSRRLTMSRGGESDSPLPPFTGGNGTGRCNGEGVGECGGLLVGGGGGGGRLRARAFMSTGSVLRSEDDDEALKC
jgi:hypothetical protein